MQDLEVSITPDVELTQDTRIEHDHMLQLGN